MKNDRPIIVYDFETDAPDPEKCNPVQLAAVPIDPETLEILEDRIFSIDIKPNGIDKDEYFEQPKREDTIKWHAKNYGITYDEVVEKWRNGTNEKAAWKSFCTYAQGFKGTKKKGQYYTEPISAGYNIIGYDAIIVEALCKRHKTKNPFSKLNKMDILDMLFYWMSHLEEPSDFKFDTMRDFFGIPRKGIAHDAVTDVLEEAALLVRFLQFFRKQSSVAKFKGAFSNA